jgi:hypothetical protein
LRHLPVIRMLRTGQRQGSQRGAAAADQTAEIDQDLPPRGGPIGLRLLSVEPE